MAEKSFKNMLTKQSSGRSGRIATATLTMRMKNRTQRSGSKLAALVKSAVPKEADVKEVEPPCKQSMDQEMELEITLMPCLMSCSRQRLRAVLIALEKYGANVQERISLRDVQAVFQECSIKLPSRSLQLIAEVYGDSHGVNYRNLYKKLQKAQSRSRRDSVVARETVGDRTHYNQMNDDHRDADYLKRIEQQLVTCSHNFDLDIYRQGCLDRDASKAGKLSIEEMTELATTSSLPIYGALLTNLLKRCDDEKNGMVSWPEFINFLMKAMENYCEKNPDKPKPGTNKPSTDSASQSSKLKTTDSVKEEDVKIDVSSSSRPRTTSFLGQLTALQTAALWNAKSASRVARKSVRKESVAGQLAAARTAAQWSRKCSVPLAESRDADPTTVLSQELSDVDLSNAKVPTQDFMINGQSIHLVIPDSIQGKATPSIDPPTRRLKLQWVYGYQGKHMRNNLHLVGQGEIAYCVAQIVVLYAGSTHKQRHYKEHTALITCMAVHSDMIQVASAQSYYLKQSAQVRLWRSDNLQTVSVISQGFDLVNSAITHLQFCIPAGKALMNHDETKLQDYRNRLLVAEKRKSVAALLSVYNVIAKKRLAEANLETSQLCVTNFNPCFPDLIVSLGKEHFVWWTFDEISRTLDNYMEPMHGMHMRAEYYTSLLHTRGGELITGDSNGTIFIWAAGSNTITNVVKHGHEASVVSLLLVDNTIISAGKDCTVKGWAYSFHMDNLFNARLPESDGFARSMLYAKDSLYVGCTGDVILGFLSPDTDRYITELVMHDMPLIQGVPGGTVAVKPLSSPDRKQYFVCAGGSGAVVLYDTQTTAAVGKDVAKGIQICSMDIAGDGSYMGLGTTLGHVLLYTVDKSFTLTQYADVTVSRSAVSIVSFSPDGSTVAASIGSKVYIIKKMETDNDDLQWMVCGVCRCSGPVDILDWSTELVDDGYYILRLTSMQSLEISLWNVKDYKKLQQLSYFQTLSWSSNKSFLYQPVAGVWYSKQSIVNGIKCLDVDESISLIALSDKCGYVCLFQYPCVAEGAFCHTYKSHVDTNETVFSRSGHVLTAGDGCVIQWSVL